MEQVLRFLAEPSLADELQAAEVEAGVSMSDPRNQAVRGFLDHGRCERDSERYAIRKAGVKRTLIDFGTPGVVGWCGEYP